MDSTSRIYTSLSFNRHSSSNIADIADRVVQELRAENGFDDDDVFSFSDDDSQANTGDGEHDEVNANACTEMVNQTEEEALDEDEQEFEFPVVCGDFDLCEISSEELVSDDQISPRYPLFDRSLLSDFNLNLCNGVDSPKIDSKPLPATRPSLMKLFNEDRDTASTSSSEAEADDLNGITPGTYCVWKPNTEPRGKHKKSNSISIGNTSNRWNVRDLLKRSFSDDNYSPCKDSPVFLFIPPISPEKVTKIEKTVKKASPAGGRVTSTKTEKQIPAYKSKIGNIGNIRLPPYLPYRQDQVAAFTSFTDRNKHVYRYGNV